jgi:hypothetical protein
LYTIDYSVQGWDAILAADMAKLDDVIPGRILGTLGETVAAYTPVYLKAADGKFWKAQADGANQPCRGLALEAGDADDEVRIVWLGEVTNGAWAWTVNGPIYLSAAVLGGLTQTPPGGNIQVIGYAITSTRILLFPAITMS